MMTGESTQTPKDQFAKALDAFRQTSLEYAHDPESLANQMIVAKAFESLVRSAQQALATEIESKSGIAPQTPKEVFVEAQDLGLIDDADIWIEALDHCQKMKKSDGPDTIQEALDFSQTYFTDAVDDLAGRQGL